MDNSQHQKKSFSARALAVAAVLAAGFLSACSDDGPNGPVLPADQQIQLISPVNGETFKIGDSLRVKWKILTPGQGVIDGVDIQVSPDTGKIWYELNLNSRKPEDEYFAWQVPASKDFQGTMYNLANTQWMIRVRQYSASNPKQIHAADKMITFVP